MSIPFLLLLLLGLGAYEAHFRGFSASDGSEFYAKSFVDVLRNAIEHKEMNHVKEMISDSFLFIGCTKNVSKDQVLQILKNVPVGAQVNFQFKSSHFIEPKKIEYTVAISGLGISLEANFVISAETSTWILVSGSVPKCPSSYGSEKHSLLEPATIQVVARLNKWLSMRHANRDILNKFISKDFKFYGCDWHYNFKDLVTILMDIPTPIVLYHISYSFPRDYAQDIVVNVTGIGKPFQAHIYLENQYTDYFSEVVLGGHAVNCYDRSPIFPGRSASTPKRSFMSAAEDPKSIALGFLTPFNNALAQRHVSDSQLRTLIADGFVFTSCLQHNYRGRFLKMLKAILFPISLKFESANYNSQSKFPTEIVASFIGTDELPEQFQSKFKFGLGFDEQKKRYLLANADPLDCQKKQKSC